MINTWLPSVESAALTARHHAQKFSNVDFSPTDFIVSFWLAAKLQKFERQRVYLQHLTDTQAQDPHTTGLLTALVNQDALVDHRTSWSMVLVLLCIPLLATACAIQHV